MRNFWKNDDSALLALAVRDPAKGFHRLMAKYGEPVYWHVRRLLVSHDDAQDAAQETFVRVFKSLSRFSGECSLRAWIFKIASNEALRILGRHHENQVSLDDSLSEVDGMAADEYVDYSDFETVKLQQARHIVDEMALDDSIAERFVDTYCRSQKEIWALVPRIGRDTLRNVDSGDSGHAEPDIQARFDRSQKILDIRKKYYAEYSKFLTQRQISRVYELERQMMVRLARQKTGGKK